MRYFVSKGNLTPEKKAMNLEESTSPTNEEKMATAVNAALDRVFLRRKIAETSN